MIGIFPLVICLQSTQKAPSVKATPDVKIVDTKVGTGAPIKYGDEITVDYTGKFTDGKVFDSSAGKTPLVFIAGTQTVIKGWDQGLLGMKVGGVRNLTIPPNLAYGVNGSGEIPPNSTLIFNVQLHKIVNVLPLVSIKTITPGTGKSLKIGDTAKFDVVIKLSTGEVFFDSSTQGGAKDSPITGGVFPGPLVLGVVGSKLGEHRIVTFPAALFNPPASAKVPANAKMILDLKVESITPSTPAK